MNRKEMSHFATLRNCLAIEEAELMRAHLESEGIRAFVRDAHTAANYGEAVIGGCRLEVVSVDAKRAEDLLSARLAWNGNEDGIDRDVFRVRSSKAASYLFYSVALVGLVFVIGKLFFPGHSGLVMAICAVIMVMASLLGRLKRDDYCATCRGKLTPQATVCDRCHGVIRGEIDHPNERLEAEERLHMEVVE